MMKLLSNPFSPYGRKVKMTLAMKGLKDRVEVLNVDTNIPANPEITVTNPLAKIPALVLESGECIYDSAVICEYLDSLTPSPQLFPKSGPERWKTLTLASLADGILDAALLLVYEKRFRPEEKWHEPWTDRQRTKIDRSLDLLEPKPPAWGASPGLRPSDAGGRARLSRFPARRQMARRPPQAGGLARSVRQGGAVLRGNPTQAVGLVAGATAASRASAQGLDSSPAQRFCGNGALRLAGCKLIWVPIYFCLV